MRADPILKLLRIIRHAVAAAKHEGFLPVQSPVGEAQPGAELLPVAVDELLRGAGVLIADQVTAEGSKRA